MLITATITCYGEYDQCEGDVGDDQHLHVVDGDDQTCLCSWICAADYANHQVQRLIDRHW